ncbi:sensor histidine kinase [uncultured Paraglaciecola sp.]|uniref:sensor histidine kinase n=1 Tax=uncultured Paraglaciecola sp. TaxID=1765024 RepID=UPI00259980C7|nr:sensor histidine kinase [uncultured Paraglaciecola sp.]
MKNRLLIKLCCIIGAGTVLLFWMIDILSNQAEQSMSFIDEQYKQELQDYAKQAEDIYSKHGKDALDIWLEELQEKEQTWAAVAASNVVTVSNSDLREKYVEGIKLGRSLDWMIHLYFDYNPIMDIPFTDKNTHFLIQLPQRMRPGKYYTHAGLAIKFALPLILLSLLSLVLYQHLMSPLRRLENATKQFSEGNFDVRINASLDSRDDELTALADTFDHMADRTSKLIASQRQMLSDLSHELRTPLTRMDMAVDFLEHQLDPKKAADRLRYEAANMRELVEDALTLAYLDTERPKLNNETFDLAELINVICEDSRFEYSNHTLIANLPEQAVIKNSSQRALGQAIENVIRNALHHTPLTKQVTVFLSKTDTLYSLIIEDEGQGVPEELLEEIFKPFFRVDKARTLSDAQRELKVGQKRNGFGLGLALAQRQIEAVKGNIKASNHYSHEGKILGLKISIELPIVSEYA